MTVKEIRRDCAEKRDAYQHAKTVYGEAIRLGLSAVSDMTALRTELQQTLLAYYAAHSALHSAMRPRTPTARLH